MVEPEMAFATLDDAIELAQALIAHIVARVLDECRRELATLERDTALLERIVPPFPRITYDEATDRLEAMGAGFVRGDDFGKEDERTLSESFEAPVIITHYPRACKAFYMKPDPKRPDRALCVDVLAPESFGEIVGGGQREDDLEALEARLQGEGLPLESFGWYLDLRRYGSVPHAGFGLGLERMVAWLCGLEHVREAIPFPRTVGRLRP
jgi:asparaginyl-tRNA synthetase